MEMKGYEHMKAMKKLASLLLALVMALALAVPAFAVDSTTITAPANNRTYKIYQIFTGDLSEKDGAKVLSNVKWGQNGTGTAGAVVDQTILDELKTVNDKSNTEKLDVIKKYVNLDSTEFGTVTNGQPLTVPTGYYLIRDVGPVGDSEAYSLFIVEVVGPTTIGPKTDAPKSEKKVKDVNDSNGTTTDWQDSADYDIGDDVPFQLKATLPAHYADYKVYKLTFHDKQSEGLTFNANSVKVYVDGNEITTGYEVKTTGLSDDCTFEVVFADLKQIEAVKAGSEITVEYTAKLNDNAKTGTTGNSNSMHITYSNNPNDEQGGEGGKTPEDITIVFTYQLIVDKTDGNNPLTGAGFTLYKKNSNGDYIAVGTEIKGGDITKFTWSGLDDGDYKLVETTTPTGYNTMEAIFFTITAEHNGTGTDPKLTSLSGNVDGNKLTFTSDVSKGSLSTTVINKAGSTLPSTGGIGTTIFYVVGSVLVIGAAVVLITRKRMGKSDK